MTREEKITSLKHLFMGGTSFEEVLKEAMDFADEHHQWISVEDELPKMSYKSGDSDDVIVCLYNGRRDIDSYDYSLEEWVFNNRDVTHWRHLPEPPTEGVMGNQGKTSPNLSNSSNAGKDLKGGEE